MKATIFFSWQSDSPASTAREPIEAALERAIERLSADTTLVLRPYLDSDTRSVPGSPDIVRTILAKIDACSVFVADVSLTFDRPDGKRRSPNPNVMLELGYALRRLGTERIILIMDVATGRPEELPFDLRSHRAITYDSRASTPVDDLGHALTKELALVLQKGLPSDLLPVELALSYSRRDIRSARHDYRFIVTAINRSEMILQDWSLMVKFPMRLLEPNQTYPFLPRSGQPNRGPIDQMAIMRTSMQEHSRPIYPEEEHPVFGIDYFVDDEIFAKRKTLFGLWAEADFFLGDRKIATARKQLRELQAF